MLRAGGGAAEAPRPGLWANWLWATVCSGTQATVQGRLESGQDRGGRSSVRDATVHTEHLPDSHTLSRIKDHAFILMQERFQRQKSGQQGAGSGPAAGGQSRRLAASPSSARPRAALGAAHPPSRNAAPRPTHFFRPRLPRRPAPRPPPPTRPSGPVPAAASARLLSRGAGSGGCASGLPAPPPRWRPPGRTPPPLPPHAPLPTPLPSPSAPPAPSTCALLTQSSGLGARQTLQQRSPRSPGACWQRVGLWLRVSRGTQLRPLRRGCCRGGAWAFSLSGPRPCGLWSGVDGGHCGLQSHVDGGRPLRSAVPCGWREVPAVWARYLRVWRLQNVGTLPAALYLHPDGLPHC